MTTLTTLMLLWGLPTESAALPPSGGTRVALLTMGPNEELYARFGHAALRVRTARHDWVYNFGYTDFSNPTLAVDVLQGRARFWAVRQSFLRTVASYQRQDRSIYQQELNLTPQQHQRLAELLAPWAGGGRRRTYVYHHYWDNCSTRPRDLIDQVVDGAVREQLQPRPLHQTFRSLSRLGFADDIPLLLATTYFLGRRGDIPLNWWQGGFLPRLLREGLQHVQINGRPLAGPPQVIYRRRAALPSGHPRRGAYLIAGLGVTLTLLCVLVWILASRTRRAAGWILMLVTLVLGILALPVWASAILISLAEIRITELVLILWPTDLLLCGLAWRMLRGRFVAGLWTRGYLVLRLASVGGLAIAHLLGWAIQHPVAWLVVAGGPLVCLLLCCRALDVLAINNEPV